MKKSLVLGLAGVALGTSALASAQGNNFNNTYVTVRAGFLVPIDTNLKDVSNSFFGVGADLTFSNAYIRGGETFLSLDFLGKTKGGGRFNVFPICLNERFYLNNGGSGPAAQLNNRTYAFIGAGAFLFDMDPTTWRFGGRGGLGVELGHNLKAEAAVYLSAGTSGTNIHANMVGLYLGYNFNTGG